MKEEKLKNQEKKNKKRLLIVLSISVFIILAGTLAYFTTSANLANIFKTSIYQNQIVEQFESPKTWTPGTTTAKTVKVTNTGNVGMALRANYTEKWVNGNGKEMPLVDKLGHRAAIINFNDSWTKDSDGYYYYGTKDNKIELAPSTTSTSFIKSVTFNGDIEATLIENISDDGKTITYSSSGNGYDNATYKLTIKIDTVQYDQATEVWK